MKHDYTRYTSFKIFYLKDKSDFSFKIGYITSHGNYFISCKRKWISIENTDGQLIILEDTLKIFHVSLPGNWSQNIWKPLDGREKDGHNRSGTEVCNIIETSRWSNCRIYLRIYRLLNMVYWQRCSLLVRDSVPVIIHYDQGNMKTRGIILFIVPHYRPVSKMNLK